MFKRKKKKKSPAPASPESVRDFADRALLAVEEIFLIMERNQVIYPYEYGQVVLRHVVSEDEVLSMAETVQTCVYARLYGQAL